MYQLYNIKYYIKNITYLCIANFVVVFLFDTKPNNKKTFLACFYHLPKKFEMF